MKLSGQVAIVTGGSSGQGWATALLFAQEGATLFKGPGRVHCEVPRGVWRPDCRHPAMPR